MVRSRIDVSCRLTCNFDWEFRTGFHIVVVVLIALLPLDYIQLWCVPNLIIILLLTLHLSIGSWLAFVLAQWLVLLPSRLEFLQLVPIGELLILQYALLKSNVVLLPIHLLLVLRSISIIGMPILSTDLSRANLSMSTILVRICSGGIRDLERHFGILILDELLQTLS